MIVGSAAPFGVAHDGFGMDPVGAEEDSLRVTVRQGSNRRFVRSLRLHGDGEVRLDDIPDARSGVVAPSAVRTRGDKMPELVEGGGKPVRLFYPEGKGNLRLIPCRVVRIAANQFARQIEVE